MSNESNNGLAGVVTKSKQDLQAQAAYARSCKTGRPTGSSNLGSKQPSALARAFKLAGLDWRTEFAKAIMNNDIAKMKFWKDMMPYLTTQNPGYRKNGGYISSKASKVTQTALDTLEEMEGR